MEGKPLYRTLVSVGMGAAAVGFLVNLVGAPNPFWVVMIVVALVGAVLNRQFAWGRWVALVLTVLLFAMWAPAFLAVVFGFAISVIDFTAFLLIEAGLLLSLVASLLALSARRRETPFTDAHQSRLRMAGVVVVVLVASSAVLTFAGRDKVDATDAADAKTIVMRDGNVFDPKDVPVALSGTKLLLHNKDRVSHNFKIDGTDIDEIVGPGSEKLVTFTPKGPGETEYTCSFHQDMKGRLVAS